MNKLTETTCQHPAIRRMDFFTGIKHLTRMIADYDKRATPENDFQLAARSLAIVLKEAMSCYLDIEEPKTPEHESSFWLGVMRISDYLDAAFVHHSAECRGLQIVLLDATSRFHEHPEIADKSVAQSGLCYCLCCQD